MFKRIMCISLACEILKMLFFTFSNIWTVFHLHLQLRVSSMLSNSPYILILDCDMYCNDSSSARQAMCFHLDKTISPKLAYVQFPQKFHNISSEDIYDSQLRLCFSVLEFIYYFRVKLFQIKPPP